MSCPSIDTLTQWIKDQEIAKIRELVTTYSAPTEKNIFNQTNTKGETVLGLVAYKRIISLRAGQPIF